jgi:hypothetical protein
LSVDLVVEISGDAGDEETIGERALCAVRFTALVGRHTRSSARHSLWAGAVDAFRL